jgi:hypothetical protein
MGVKLGPLHEWQDKDCLFENRTLKDIFGPKKEEAIGECRKLHNKDLHIMFTRY